MLILLLILVLGVVTLYFWRRIRIFIEEQTIEFTLKRLNQTEYKVIRSLVLAGSFIDYLVISQAGVFVIKKCNFRKRNSFLIGDEEERIWNYYEPYVTNPKGLPTSVLQEAPVENANRIPLNNPIIECKRAIKFLEGNFDKESYQVEFHPVIVLVPKIKGVNLHRKKNSRAKVIFVNSFEETLLDQEATLISITELGEVRDRILNSSGVRRAG